MEVFQGKRCVLLLFVGNEGMTFSLLKKMSKTNSGDRVPEDFAVFETGVHGFV